METKEANRLGELIKSALKSKSISMRGFGRLSGISTPTVSRIISGQQEMTLEQMKKISGILDIPIHELLSAVDIICEEDYVESFWYSIIKDILLELNIDLRDVVRKIERALNINCQYASLPEGREEILEQFPKKVENLGNTGAILEKLKLMFRLFSGDILDDDEKAVLGGALLYFIQATDEIPDYIFPLGYLDDAIAVAIAMNHFDNISHT